MERVFVGSLTALMLLAVSCASTPTGAAGGEIVEEGATIRPSGIGPIAIGEPLADVWLDEERLANRYVGGLTRISKREFDAFRIEEHGLEIFVDAKAFEELLFQSPIAPNVTESLADEGKIRGLLSTSKEPGTYDRQEGVEHVVIGEKIWEEVANLAVERVRDGAPATRIVVRDSTFQTEKGIAVGDTFAAVESTYDEIHVSQSEMASVVTTEEDGLRFVLSEGWASGEAPADDAEIESIAVGENESVASRGTDISYGLSGEQVEMADGRTDGDEW